MQKQYDYLIVGAGIIGMTIAYEILQRNKKARIAIVEKEDDVAKHASGRNSGVLHAGFYYTADSLKARFTVDGNELMRRFCKEHDIPVKDTKKLVIAKNADELDGLYELQRRAEVNNVATTIISDEEAKVIDSNVKTYKKALYSPRTASVDPKKVCFALKNLLQKSGVDFYFNTHYPSNLSFDYEYLINAAGAYADTIAHYFGLAKDFAMLPFKGVYLKYTGSSMPAKVNIYPVPNLNNPFLGIHFTITSDGSVKIGPTAIPAFWRENYEGFDRFNLFEMIKIVYYEAKLFFKNSFHFRDLALQEIKNYKTSNLVKEAKKLVEELHSSSQPLPAGIRAQLLNTKTYELVQDFVVEHETKSTHILNAVSPAFTCSFAFAKYVVDEIEINKKKGDVSGK